MENIKIINLLSVDRFLYKSSHNEDYFGDAGDFESFGRTNVLIF